MNPIKFIQEVRKEGSKVTWPTTRETLTGAVMVLIITTFAAVFFLIVDQIFSFGLNSIIDWSLQMTHKWYIAQAYSGYEKKLQPRLWKKLS